MSNLQFRVLDGFGTFGAEAWQKPFGPSAQGYPYYRACELAPPEAFEVFAAGVMAGQRLVAGCPMFRVVVRLDRLMDGAMRQVGHWLHKTFPLITDVTVVGAGSPYCDDSSIVFVPELDAAARGAALEILLAGIRDYARDTGAGLVILKGVSDRHSGWTRPHLAKMGYTAIASLPLARLSLPPSEEQYFAGLSQNMRSNLRRKLKRAGSVRVEVRDSAAGLETELAALRDATRSRGKADYDVFANVSPQYFSRVLEACGASARLLSYWDEDRLLGFALVLLEPDRVIEMYTGMRYPEGIEKGVFFLNWMTLVRLGIAQGCRELHAGETTYLTKARLGCTFDRCWIYVRHRTGLVNPILRAVAPMLALDRTDPDLKKLGESAPYA